MASLPSELDAIGRKFGTDKSSVYHDYLRVYERFFRHLRNEPLKILEVGVFNGASLKVWEEYFPNSRIVGADIDETTRRFAGGRVEIEIIDQSNLEDLVRLGVRHGPFDIIIDDGSHIWDHQITTLRTLFPFLKDGGIYVVEDLETNYGPYVANYRGRAAFSCVEYLKRLVDYRVADNYLDITAEEDAFLRTYGRSVFAITFVKHLCLLEKQVQVRTTNVSLTETDTSRTAVPVSITAHVGFVGDVVQDSCVACPPDLLRNIQGFSIHIPDEAMADLSYRARLQDGSWTEWAADGGFVGTKGQSANVSGFTLRFDKNFTDTHDIRILGAFTNHPVIVEVAPGEDCALADATASLRAIQVVASRKDQAGRE
ncbi:MAG TPA: class I SAM-dependent methyltransferase [Acidocella sp.]|jgi:hypothetical protein|uniref:class I SAM-dependent methyltransferase n=1 Tax=Acidocella sp. TaxID=50710 RepID=UPI002CCC1423|nr:class I SAM-dependent methyltransferase [Acidocella sp.]HVE23015.1 class I SAM-dependent methyltransferase [Acidocella sp.]